MAGERAGRHRTPPPLADRQQYFLAAAGNLDDAVGVRAPNVRSAIREVLMLVYVSVSLGCDRPRNFLGAGG
jgi:hypothetical protein